MVIIIDNQIKGSEKMEEALKQVRLKTLEEALNMSPLELEENYKEYLNPYFVSLLKLLGLNKRFVKAEGTKLWDENQLEYTDFLGAYGALNLGHNHKGVINKLQGAFSLPNLLQTAMHPLNAALASNLSKIAPGELKYSFFCNSGAEAVEGALKLAKIATGKSRIIYCKGSFHGKSFGALAVTGRDKYKKHFGPMVPLAEEVEYGSIKELRNLIDIHSDIAAFILEPIQGEGGIIVPPKGYLKDVREICTQNNILMILDEVQTGLGRTGSWFACEDEEIAPDIMCMAKSLGGGIMPMGAYLATEAVWKSGYGSIDKCLLHTSTFGGNTFACAAALATIEIIQEERLHLIAKEKGEYFLSKLKILKDKYPILKEVRGRGLMIGLEFSDIHNTLVKRIITKSNEEVLQEYIGGMIASELANNYRIITAYTLNNPNVIRVEPPLIISYEEIDYFLRSLESILEKKINLTSMIMKTTKNIFKAVQ